MFRFTVSTVVVVALAFMCALSVNLATAAVLFSEGFENHVARPAPPPDPGNPGITQTNGWFLDQNNPPDPPGTDRPDIFNTDPTMGPDNYADGTSLAGGSGDSLSRNDPATLAGGLDPARTYTLSWTWKVNTDPVFLNDPMDPAARTTHGTSFGLYRDTLAPKRVRPSVQIGNTNGGQIIYNSAVDLPGADDVKNVPGGFGPNREIDFELFISSSLERYTAFEAGTSNVITSHSSNLGNLAAEMPNIQALFWFVNNLSANPNRDNGLIDNIVLRDDTPDVNFPWKLNKSGDWNNQDNWLSASPPDDPTDANASAVFGGAIASTQTVFTNTNVTVNDLQFNNVNSHIVSGGGTINLQDATDGSFPIPGITVAQGSHEIQNKIAMNDASTVSVTSGQLDLNNEINTNGNTLTLSGAVNVNHSVVGGGAIVTSGAVLGTAGTTGVGADLTLNGTSTLSIDIAGDLTNQFSKFDIGTNAVGLSSADLEIDLDGFTPDPSDTFEILDSLTLSGALSNVANGATLSTAGGEGTFVVNYGAGSAFDVNSVVLSNFAPSTGGNAGDFNNDGVVNAADYPTWLDNFGGPETLINSAGDGSGTVDLGDYAIWKTNFQAGVGTGTATAIPEPASAGLLCAGMGLLVTWRRSRRVRS